MKFKTLLFSLGLLALTAVSAEAAELGAMAQAVLPATTRQIISIDYQRLGTNPLAKSFEDKALPPQMRDVGALLKHGGLDPQHTLNHLTFATFGDKGRVGFVGIAEGSFQNLKKTNFFRPTKLHPHPPQYNGVDLYESQGLTFIIPDQSTLVFGDRSSVKKAIDAEQGSMPRLDGNEQMTDLIAGTQSSDVWSVLDAAGTRNMVGSLVKGATQVNLSTFENELRGSRYTVQFNNDIQLNLEVLTHSTMAAAALSTGMRAAVAYEQYQEKSPQLKALLNNVEVDSSGTHAFLQVSSPETTVAQLASSDLMKNLTH